MPYLSESPRPRGVVAGYHTHPSGTQYFSFSDADWVNDRRVGTRMPLYMSGNDQISVCEVRSASCSTQIALHFNYDQNNRGLQGRIAK